MRKFLALLLGIIVLSTMLCACEDSADVSKLSLDDVENNLEILKKEYGFVYSDKEMEDGEQVDLAEIWTEEINEEVDHYGITPLAGKVQKAYYIDDGDLDQNYVLAFFFEQDAEKAMVALSYWDYEAPYEVWHIARIGRLVIFGEAETVVAIMEGKAAGDTMTTASGLYGTYESQYGKTKTYQFKGEHFTYTYRKFMISGVYHIDTVDGEQRIYFKPSAVCVDGRVADLDESSFTYLCGDDGMTYEKKSDYIVLDGNKYYR